MSTDIIDLLAGIEPDSHLDQLRRRRPDTREHAQRSFLALFSAGTPETHAVAAFVTALHEDQVIAGFYAERVPGELAAAVNGEVEAARTTGPYGIYPDASLAAESVTGLVYRVGDREALGERLAAAFEHAHLLVFRPREASPAALRALTDAGWSTTEIVTLSQLVAFLSFQVRVIAGLRLLQKGLAA